MADIAFLESLRNERLQKIVDRLDAAATPGKIKLYTAPRPATGGAITTQTLLGTLVLSDPCATISAGQLTFESVSDDISADAGGMLDWGRGEDGDGNFVADMGCGTAGSGKTLIFNTLVVIEGGLIEITGGQLIEGNA